MNGVAIAALSNVYSMQLVAQLKINPITDTFQGNLE